MREKERERNRERENKGQRDKKEADVMSERLESRSSLKLNL